MLKITSQTSGNADPARIALVVSQLHFGGLSSQTCSGSLCDCNVLSSFSERPENDCLLSIIDLMNIDPLISIHKHFN